MTIILIRTVFPDEPDTVKVFVQFRDKCYHFLAVSKSSLHEVKNTLQCLCGSFCLFFQSVCFC